MILADKVAVAADVAGVSHVLLLNGQTLCDPATPPLLPVVIVDDASEETYCPELRVVLLIPGCLVAS
jgi:hypothetical protein